MELEGGDFSPSTVALQDVTLESEGIMAPGDGTAGCLLLTSLWEAGEAVWKMGLAGPPPISVSFLCPLVQSIKASARPRVCVYMCTCVYVCVCRGGGGSYYAGSGDKKILYFSKTKCCWPREVFSFDVLCLLLLAVSKLAQRRQALTRHFRIIQTHLFFFLSLFLL